MERTVRVFVSSTWQDLQPERQAVEQALQRMRDAGFSGMEYFGSRPDAPRDVCLQEVDRADVYLGIFGYDYGFEDEGGVSPTECEFLRASELGKVRLVYVWGTDERRRASKMKQLVRKASGELIRRRIEDASALTAEVYASLVDHLDRLGALRIPPFDAAPCDTATLKNVSRKRVEWFLRTARRERGFPLKANTSTRALLTHLNLLDDGKPTNAAACSMNQRDFSRLSLCPLK